MLNKNTINVDTKNSVFTPKEIVAALASLPYNYILLTQEILGKKVNEGSLKKNFSKNWIIKVRKGEEFNEDILSALVEVGRATLEKEGPYGFLKKKTPATK